MDANIVNHDLAKAQYADGVFIRLTGGMVHDFQPEAKRAGWHDAGNGMTLAEKTAWLDYCVTVRGYVPRPWLALGPEVKH